MRNQRGTPDAGTMLFLLAAGLMLLASGSAFGQVPPLWQDDFETNLDPVSREPDGWEQLMGKGFPQYNQIIFPDTKTPHFGKNAVKFRVLGGNMAIELSAFLPVTAGRTYRASGWIRTSKLKKSAAFLALQIYDKRGMPLKLLKSDPVEGTSDWTYVEVFLGRAAADVRFVRPLCYLEGTDKSGEAWFDTMQIVEQSWIELDTSRAASDVARTEIIGNIYADEKPQSPQPQKIDAVVRIRGASAGKYLVELKCTDYDGRPAATPLTLMTNIDESGGQDVPVSIELLRRGYAEVEASAWRDDGTGKLVITGASRTSIGVLSPDLVLQTAGAWIGTSIDPYPAASEQLVPLLSMQGCPLVLLQVWNETMPPLDEALASPQLESLIAAASEKGIEFIGTLGTQSLWARRSILADAGAENTLLFLRDETLWRPPLLATLERLKANVNKWLFGAPDAADPNSQLLSPQIKEKLAEAVRTVIKFPELGVPCSIVSTSPGPALRTEQPSSFGFRVVQVPGATPPGELVGILNPFLSTPGKTLPSLSLQPIPMHKDKWPAVRTQVGDLAKQLTALRAAGVGYVFVSPMQGEAAGLVDERGHPTAAFYAVLVMNRVLGGKTYDPRPVFGHDVAHMVFHGQTESAVVLWLPEGSSAQPKKVPVSLGGDLRVMHLDGAESRLIEEGGTQYVEVTDLPCVLVGVQSSFLQMQLSTVFDPPVVNCAEGRQRLQLDVTNTFPGATIETLDIRLLFPPEWSVTRTMRTVAQIAPGKTATLITEIAMPLRETLGDKEIQIDLCAYVRGEKYLGRIVRKLTVASEIDTSLDFDKDASGSVTALSVRVDNLGDRHVDAKLYIQIPGMPEREIAVRSLAPKSFRVAKIPVSRQAEAQGDVTVHLVEEGGKRLFLNDRIRLP